MVIPLLLEPGDSGPESLRGISRICVLTEHLLFSLPLQIPDYTARKARVNTFKGDVTAGEKNII
jgi:hypothetical protein